MGQILFVTATDTGAGKTTLTALLLLHLRHSGIHALATKPFCTGPLGDVQLLSRAQEHEVEPQVLNPFHFPEPVAPAVAAKLHRQDITLVEVVQSIQKLADRCEILIVEGAGGLLVPLGASYTVADLLGALHCPVLVAIRNRLGCVNHALLTLRTLEAQGASPLTAVLLDSSQSNIATRTNFDLIKLWAPEVPLFQIPYLGPRARAFHILERAEKNLKKLLASISGSGIFSSLTTKFERNASEKLDRAAKARK
jgi:dethiobiotin synthetase